VEPLQAGVANDWECKAQAHVGRIGNG
jgi:hypothetical protein